jgi:uncharacterized repeat protein (TIGR03803 family)
MSLSCSRRIPLMCLCLLVATPVRAQYAFQILKEFHSPFVGIQGGVLRTSDGMLYASSYAGGLNQIGGIFSVKADGTGFAVLHFSDTTGGYLSQSALMAGADGALYGTAQSGGGFGVGTIFKIQADGTGFTVLHSFDTVQGSYPYAGLVQGGDGTLYGATTQGGFALQGTIFKMQPDGSGFLTLHDFAGSDGRSPQATLTLAGGRIFGTTYLGGSTGSGTTFSLGTDGSGFTTLHSFSTSDGANPYAPLIQAVDGALYGTTVQGGTSGLGTIFKIQMDGTAFTVLASLSASTGVPSGGVIQGLDGALYGPGQICCTGGTVYRIGTDGTNLTVLHTFTPLQGSNPISPLVQAPDGTLYGVTQGGGSSNDGAVFKLDANGGNFATLYSLEDETRQGSALWGPVLIGAKGALIGVTLRGGTSGAGTVFRLSNKGTAFTVLHELEPAQGQSSKGGLIRGLDGAFYGTTGIGGTFQVGSVFKIQASGSGFKVLHSFDGNAGNQPQAGLTQGPDGTLYGTTLYGGVFKLEPDGSAFANLGGSYLEYSGVALGPDGLLYGAMSQGGPNGSVFRMATDGTGFTVLHVFSGTDGSSPNGLILIPGSTSGSVDVYGTTQNGGADGQGSVFTMATDGSGFTTLHSFAGLDGGSPAAPLLQAGDGTLIGTTQSGGSGGAGTVFAMNPDGTNFAVLHSFGGADGATPFAGVVVDHSGAIYGTTYQGGPLGGGVVFKLSPLPLLSVHDTSVPEGGVASFKVTLSGIGVGPVTVSYATSDGTALAGTDYEATSGTLTFATGTLVRTVSVTTLDDKVRDRKGAFLLTLTNPTGAGLGRAQAVGTITE